MSDLCSECGKTNELRPYGKDGAMICYDCGMLNREQTDYEFDKLMPKGNALLTSNGPIPYIGKVPHE